MGCSTSVKLLLAIVRLSLSLFRFSRVGESGTQVVEGEGRGSRFSKTRDGDAAMDAAIRLLNALSGTNYSRERGKLSRHLHGIEHAGISWRWRRKHILPRDESSQRTLLSEEIGGTVSGGGGGGGCRYCAGGVVATPLLLPCHTVHSFLPRFHYLTGKSKRFPRGGVAATRDSRDGRFRRGFERDQV